MRLIPGVLVATSVIATIDRDGNSAFSNDEQRSYSQQVLDDLTIMIDAKSVRPKLIAWSFCSGSARNGGGVLPVR
jgi:hypothetical protein